MDVVPFMASHLEQMELQGAQAYLSGWVSKKQGLALEKQRSFTGIVEGLPIAVGGIINQWPGRGLAWAFLSDVGPKNFISIHRAASEFFNTSDLRRIEMTVDCEFYEAHRWAKMLGFSMEAERMAAYGPDGRDCSLYARVR